MTESRMRTFRVLSVIALLCTLSASAQQPAPPAQVVSQPGETKIVTAATLAASIAAQPADRNGNAPFIQYAPYSVNMEHRVMGQAPAVHENDAELFYVIDGAGTIVTGGKLAGERRTNAANLTGTAVENGISKKVAKGDWVLVPAGVPHWFPSVEGSGLTLMSLHLPKG